MAALHRITATEWDAPVRPALGVAVFLSVWMLGMALLATACLAAVFIALA
jgi:hypothetical protein